MSPILIIGIITLTGFIFGEIASKIKLPKVTGYILAGIFLNPSLFKFIPQNFVDHTDLITNIALSFITFSVGGTLLYSDVKEKGKGIVYITICEAELAFIAVIAGFLLITSFFIHQAQAGWLNTFIPLSVLIGSLGSPTDPAATLAIAHEYKAKGEVTSTVMAVAAFDDATGIMNFSLALAIANVCILHQGFAAYHFFLQLFIIIAGSILLGIVFGVAFNKVTYFIKKQSEGVYIVLILALLSLCFGIATILGFDELLSTMTMGAVVVNYNPEREKIFMILERYTEQLIFIIFFSLSGMHLNFSVFSKYFFLIIFFVILRATGKIVGTFSGAYLSQSSLVVKKYAAWGLIPQGGIVIGLALLIKQNRQFAGISDIILSVIIGATVIHEMIGPVLSKMMLKKAGEI